MERKSKKNGNKAVALFFGIVIVLSAVTETMILCEGPEWLYLVLMWIPAVAALLASCVSLREQEENVSLKKLFISVGFHSCKLRYILLACLFPLVYLLIPYLIYWRIYPENFAYQGVSFGVILKDLFPVLVLGTLLSLLSALGEEIGWRGFLVPALYERVGLNKMLLISGLFWCGWHLPLLIGGGYMTGTPLWYQLPAFVLCIFPVGVMTGILTLKSGSIWPAVFLHAAHNNYDQAVFDVITAGDNRSYYVSETGVLTILCTWILAVVLYQGARSVVASRRE